MRRIDALLLAFAFFLFGGMSYMVLRIIGLPGETAGIWSQVIVLLGLLGWLSTYLFRVATGNMTLHQQMERYKTALLRQRLAEMTPEELAELETSSED
ncbi:MAG: DUF3007 family protein [Pseudanabaenaceae cyanobacterium SKYGB_i_bin29]|nr:DUF3007 family protein [Pseudanabaenaceae cyanobacterium SKYG29]MDW8422282.1 DUF3007 family protein [Pseudanabaenaceae cyanobacterium SKYGB_i_bin29]